MEPSTMPIAAFDHAVIPTSQPEEMIAFYKRLGFTVVGEQAWRERKARMFAFACGDFKINVHTPEIWQNKDISLRGPTAVPGCGDFCFVWDGTVESAAAALREAGADIIEGPIERVGGRTRGTKAGTSLYTRDPDGNLLELITYAD
jgi:catechol 2,3-dioxygenase-like lactoylglutathione lyase family enzyme